MQLEVARELVHRLEIARDHRPLASHEEVLRQKLKSKSLGLSSLQRNIARQESHLQWLSEGDAPTKFFHIHMNGCHRKMFIYSLEVDGRLVRDENAKAEAAYEYFEVVLGTPPVRSNAINFTSLDIPSFNLTGLDERFPSRGQGAGA